MLKHNSINLSNTNIKIIAITCSVIIVICVILLIFFLVFKKRKNTIVTKSFSILDMLETLNIKYYNIDMFEEYAVKEDIPEIDILPYDNIANNKIDILFKEFNLDNISYDEGNNIILNKSDLIIDETIYDNIPDIIDLELNTYDIQNSNNLEYYLDYRLLRYLTYGNKQDFIQKFNYVYDKYFNDNKSNFYFNVLDSIVDNIKKIDINDNFEKFFNIDEMKYNKFLNQVNTDLSRLISSGIDVIVNFLPDIFSQGINQIEFLKLILKIILLLFGCTIYYNDYTQGSDYIGIYCLIFSKLDLFKSFNLYNYINKNIKIIDKSLLLKEYINKYGFALFSTNYNQYYECFNDIFQNYCLFLSDLPSYLTKSLVQKIYTKKYYCYDYYSVMYYYYFLIKLNQFLNEHYVDALDKNIKEIIYFILSIKIYMFCLNYYGNIPINLEYDIFIDNSQQNEENKLICNKFNSLQNIISENSELSNIINSIKVDEYNNIPFIVKWKNISKLFMSNIDSNISLLENTCSKLYDFINYIDNFNKLDNINL